METSIKFDRTNYNKVIISVINFNTLKKGISFDDFANAAEDNDFSLDSGRTGHLILIDNRYEEVFVMNDYGVDVIDELNERGFFHAEQSILSYSNFQ